MPGPADAVVRTTSGLASGLSTFHGFHVDAGAAAQVEIRDGSAGGKILATCRLGAAGEKGPFFFERGIATAGGIFVQIVSGTPSVTVFGS